MGQLATAKALMAKYKIISSDSHVLEPPDLWTGRIDPEFRDRAPYMARDGEYDQWYVEKDLKVGAIGLISQVGVRFEAPENITSQGRFEDAPAGGYDPHAAIKDMDLDGVQAALLYPSQGLFLYKLQDSALLSAVCRAYNNWLADFCHPYPDRLKGIAMLNLDDVQNGIGEMGRSAKLGLAGAMISVYPLVNRQYDRPEYDPFWAAAQEMDIPITLHTATQRPGPGLPVMASNAVQGASQTATFRANIDYWVRNSLADMIFSGVFERYPSLKVVVAEFELAWIPHFLKQMDYVYAERHQQATYRFKNDLIPSDFFHRNVRISFQEDDLGIQLRHIIGVDNLMWGSDYPHSESTWPRSRQVLEEILAGVPDDEKVKITGANAAKLYDID